MICVETLSGRIWDSRSINSPFSISFIQTLRVAFSFVFTDGWSHFHFLDTWKEFLPSFISWNHYDQVRSISTTPHPRTNIFEKSIDCFRTSYELHVFGTHCIFKKHLVEDKNNFNLINVYHHVPYRGRLNTDTIFRTNQSPLLYWYLKWLIKATS